MCNPEFITGLKKAVSVILSCPGHTSAAMAAVHLVKIKTLMHRGTHTVVFHPGHQLAMIRDAEEVRSRSNAYFVSDDDRRI